MLDNDFVRDFVISSEISKDSMIVYLELLSLCDEDNFCTENVYFLQSRRIIEGVSECLFELEKNGLIVKIDTPDIKGYYVVTSRKFYDLLVTVRGLEVVKFDDNREEKVNVKDSEAECESVLVAYNTICKSLHRAYKVTPKKRDMIDKVLHTYTVEDLKLCFIKTEESDFLCGRTNNGYKRKNGDLWRPGLEWILCHVEEILDGKYDNRQNSTEDALNDWGGGN